MTNCEHGNKRCGLCHDKSGALWADAQLPVERLVMAWTSTKDALPKLTENGCSDNLIFCATFKDGHKAVHHGYYTGRWRIFGTGSMETRSTHYEITHWMKEPVAP